MKILYLIHQFYPEFYTGTEKVFFNITNMMQKIGNKIKVITYSFCDNSLFDKSIGNILYREFTYIGIPVIAFKYKEALPDFNYTLQNDELKEFTYKILENEKPDIVHVGHPMRMGEFILSCSNLNIPYIITLTDLFLLCPKYIFAPSKQQLCAGPHGGNACKELCPDLSDNLIVGRLKVAEKFLRNAKSIISPSNFIANIYKNEFDNIDIKVIGHGINTINTLTNKKSYKKKNNLIFCYAGSLSSHKGIEVLINAFKNINFDNVYLKIYGSSPDKKYIDGLQYDSKHNKQIQFCGIYSQDNIGQVFNDIDVIIIPSVCYESYSMILHEAFAYDIPVIVSDIGALGEKVKNDYNGFKFRPGDSNQLRDIINKIIKNPEILSTLKNNLKNSLIPTIEQEAYVYEREYKYIINKNHK